MCIYVYVSLASGFVFEEETVIRIGYLQIPCCMILIDYSSIGQTKEWGNYYSLGKMIIFRWNSYLIKSGLPITSWLFIPHLDKPGRSQQAFHLYRSISKFYEFSHQFWEYVGIVTWDIYIV